MRAATNHDLPDILAAMRKMLQVSKSPQMKYADLMEAELHVRNAIHQNGMTVQVTQDCKAVVNDGFFILYDVGPPWYSSENYLIEELILKIGDSVDGVDGAIKCLDKLKVYHGCVLIAAGDTQGGVIKDRYLENGYVVLGHQLIKE